MTDRFTGKVALITGAARGQGRSHAVRLAEEGADIIAIDACAEIDRVEYALPSIDELEETAALITSLGRRVHWRQVDVRDFDALERAVDGGVDALGGLDIVCANAGVLINGPAHLQSETDWTTTIDINLTGVWHTAKAAIPHLVNQGRGGSIIITSSAMGLRAAPNIAGYVASKWGVVGLMKSLALELAEHRIRVNTIHPTNVETPMIDNEMLRRRFRPDLSEPTREHAMEALSTINAWPLAWVEPADASHAVLFLASEEARYITGTALPVDLGATIK